MILRSSRWQILGVALGLGCLLAVVLLSAARYVLLPLWSLVVLYVGWTYPLRCVVDARQVMVRTAFRSRTLEWAEIVRIRRTRGPLRRVAVGQKRRLRPTPGALVAVLEDRRQVLLLGQTEHLAENRALVAMVSGVSPALADSLRLS